MDADLMLTRSRRQGKDVWLVWFANESGSVIYRYTNNDEDIVWDGDTYTHFNLTIDPPASQSDGGLPVTDIHLSNVSRAMQTAFYNNNFFRRGEVNLLLFNTGCPAADYDDQIRTLYVTNHTAVASKLTLHCGLMKEFTELTPNLEYGAYNCSFLFGDAWCKKVPESGETCNQTRQECRDKSNSANFGAEPGMEGGALRLGL